ncbi:PKD domain-containing protein [Carboxylicivirga linearis]|uniref:PD40 domain-containing protein n=1 Tax=Carboxylicivirga linearis TaxID=1628157 RepID=A0ABS5JRI7_9BACT|nr:PKD domain-containing protein [Carboxylicivirga linearis]MBS2097016.1 PD40 domain-containing protein [Carboxylicivirga linearis]
MKVIYLTISLLIAITSGAVAQDVQIQKLPFSSSSNNEMSPFLRDSILYYSSNQPVSFLKRYYDDNKQLLYHIFSAQLNADSTFTKPVRFEKDFLSPFNTGSITFSEDGNVMFVGQNHYDTYKRSQRSRSGNLMGVYQSEMGNRGWSRKNNLPFNSRRNYNTAQPTISSDGQFLFFISDMEEGYGKTDIYYSEKINEEWGPAINMGDKINTSESELFPFYHSSGKLYFASNGHGGKGGLDLFYSLQTEEGWSTPIALDDDINTEANDFSCFISEDEQWGFFGSDRDGTDNLYRFDRLFPIFEACELQQEDSYCFEFYDDMTLEADDTEGPYKYQWTFNNTDKAMGDTVLYCFKGPGEYSVKLSMIDTSIGEEIFALSEYTIDVTRIEQIYITAQEDIKINQEITFDVTESHLGDFTPKEFYWDMGDGTLLKGETIHHIFRTKGKYLIKCGAISTKHPLLKMCSIKEIIVSD